MMMDNDEQLLRIKAEAQPQLFRIPGVRAVAIGHKYVAGQNTRQISIIVKVEKKRPRSEVPDSEMIPAQIEGVPVDVVEWKPSIPCGKMVHDDKKERPLLGGMRIEIEFEDHDVSNAMMTKTLNSGTLGFIAKTDGTISGVPKDGIVGVTCQHVVADPFNAKKTPKGHKVGQPTPLDCSRCSSCCYDIVGNVLYGAEASHVDAAIIALDKGLKYYRDIKSIGSVTDVRVLKPSDFGMVLMKYGVTTGLTKGKLKDGFQTVKLGADSFADGEFTIEPDPSTPVWDCCLCDEGPRRCGGGNLENFPAFGCKGDSGAAVVDAQRRVVGILAQVSCGGEGTAIGIDLVMKALGITALTASAPQETQGVPAIAGVNAMADGSGQVAPMLPASIGQQELLDEVRHELAGNLCRCGSYSRIMASVLDAAERLRTSDGPAVAAPE